MSTSISVIQSNQDLISQMSTKGGKMGSLVKIYAGELAGVVEASSEVEIYNAAKLLEKDYPIEVVRGTLNVKALLRELELDNLLSYENLAKVIQMFDLNNEDDNLLVFSEKINERVNEFVALGRTLKEARISFNKRFKLKLEQADNNGTVMGFMDFIETL